MRGTAGKEGSFGTIEEVAVNGIADAIAIGKNERSLRVDGLFPFVLEGTAGDESSDERCDETPVKRTHSTYHAICQLISAILR